jgi:tetratricopeptide (TPR) repeat protein
VYSVLGEPENAIASDREAAAMLKPLYEKGGADKAEKTKAYALSLTALGSKLSENGEFDEATQALSEAVRVQREDRTASDAELSLAACYQNQAANLSRIGDYNEAIEILLTCEEYLAALPKAEGKAARTAYMTTCQNLGTAYAQLGEYTEATKWINAQIIIAEEFYEEAPTRTNLISLASSCASFANVATLAGDKASAESYFARAIEYYTLLAEDSDNVSAAEELATVYANYGASLNVAGDYQGADEYYHDALDIRESLYASADGAAHSPMRAAAIARIYYNIAENHLDMDDFAGAKEAYQTCLDLYGPASESLGGYHRSEYLSRRSYYELIFDKDPKVARKTAEEAVALMPSSSFAHYMLAYALLYDEDPAAIEEFELLTSRGQNEIDNIKEDLSMQEKLGLHSSLSEEIKLSLY